MNIIRCGRGRGFSGGGQQARRELGTHIAARVGDSIDERRHGRRGEWHGTVAIAPSSLCCVASTNTYTISSTCMAMLSATSQHSAPKALTRSMRSSTRRRRAPSRACREVRLPLRPGAALWRESSDSALWYRKEHPRLHRLKRRRCPNRWSAPRPTRSIAAPRQ